MACNTNTFKIPEWYVKDEYVGFELIELTEREVCDSESGIPDGTFNQMTLKLKSIEGETADISFYNYRIIDKNFEFTPLVKFTWESEECFEKSNGIFYIGIRFSTGEGKVCVVEITFEVFA